MKAGARLRVLMSFTADRGDISVNPYTSLLERSLRPYCDVERFTWRRALLGGYQVLHCHWPEHLVGNTRWHRRTVAQMLLVVLLVLLRLRRVAVVKTVHNEAPHATPSRISNALLHHLDSLVDVRIHLHAASGANEVFAHGDYRSWFADAPREVSGCGQLAYFGRVQPYKNVDGLLESFAGVDDPSLRLTVAGSVVAMELETRLRDLAAADDRVSLQLYALRDDELARLVTGAEVVVLPYGYLYNSGVLLLALSLERPVIVPESDLADQLAAEVGEQWVVRYRQPLDAERLVSALNRVREHMPERVGPPRFAGRDWAEQAVRLVKVYRTAVAARRG